MRERLTVLLGCISIIFAGIITLIDKELAESKFGITEPYNAYFGILIILIGLISILFYYFLSKK